MQDQTSKRAKKDRCFCGCMSSFKQIANQTVLTVDAEVFEERLVT